MVLNLTKDEELPASLVELSKKLKAWESLSRYERSEERSDEIALLSLLALRTF